VFGLSLGTVTYNKAALERGWSSMTSFANPKSALMIVAFGGLLSAVVLTGYYLAWWQVPITILAGYALMAASLGGLRQASWLPAHSLFLMAPYTIAIARPL